MTDIAKLVDLLTSETPLDYKAVALELAKQSPAQFIKLCEDVRDQARRKHVEPWIRQVAELLNDPTGFVPAIKKVRERATPWNEGRYVGLKEGKDICDSLRDFMRKGGSKQEVLHDILTKLQINPFLAKHPVIEQIKQLIEAVDEVARQ